MKNEATVWIVIPAYNEEKTIGQVIRGLKKQYLKNIIVVNDGSHDETAKIAERAGAKVYTHIINRGLGGALGTGIAAALRNNAEIIATCDADGQHNPSDVKRAIDFLRENSLDVVIGSRLINSEGMPVSRRFGNRAFNLVTFLLFGLYSTDTQSGLRVFSRKAAEKISIKTNKMEVSSEIIKEISRNNLKLGEIPIKAIYTDYSLQKGQKSLNGFNILYKLILRRVMG